MAEGQAGPLQSGSTVLGEVATKLTNMFVMVDREAKNAKIHVNFLTEKVEEGTGLATLLTIIRFTHMYV